MTRRTCDSARRASGVYRPTQDEPCQPPYARSKPQRPTCSTRPREGNGTIPRVCGGQRSRSPTHGISARAERRTGKNPYGASLEDPRASSALRLLGAHQKIKRSDWTACCALSTRQALTTMEHHHHQGKGGYDPNRHQCPPDGSTLRRVDSVCEQQAETSAQQSSGADHQCQLGK